MVVSSVFGVFVVGSVDCVYSGVGFGTVYLYDFLVLSAAFVGFVLSVCVFLAVFFLVYKLILGRESLIIGV